MASIIPDSLVCPGGRQCPVSSHTQCMAVPLWLAGGGGGGDSYKKKKGGLVLNQLGKAVHGG